MTAPPPLQLRRGRNRGRRSVLRNVRWRNTLTQPTSCRKKTKWAGTRRDTQARSVQHISPTYRGGFESDITNRGVLGRVQRNGAGGRGGEASRSPDRKKVPQGATPAPPESRKRGFKPSCSRRVCGVVFCADGEACKKCTPGTVHRENKRLCFACHRPSTDWTHFSQEYLPRVTQCLEETKNRGVALPIAVLEGSRPSTDCLCTRRDCIALFLRMEDMAIRRKRLNCAVCKAYNPSKTRSLPSAYVADAMRFYHKRHGCKKER